MIPGKSVITETPAFDEEQENLKDFNYKNEDHFQRLTDNFWKEIIPSIKGKYLPKKKKGLFMSPSSISVQEPFLLEIERARTVVQTQHPLSFINPQAWKNIPICLREAIQNIIKSICCGGDQLFDYQIMMNERLWRLQKQIDSIKHKQSSCEQSMLTKVDGKIKFYAQVQDQKLPDITKQITGTMDQMEDVILQQQRLQQTTEQRIEHGQVKLNEFGNLVRESLLQLENTLVDLNRVTIEKI